MLLKFGDVSWFVEMNHPVKNKKLIIQGRERERNTSGKKIP